MKREITVFHFTQPSKKQIVGYYERLSIYGAVICFDFEDILMDLSRYLYSEDERGVLRSAIAETLKELFRQISSPKAGVRLNNISSTYFEQDLRTLKLMSPAVFLDAIFIPKAETPDEVITAIKALHNQGICFREIIPVIETKRGMENIKSILSLTNKEFNKIAFGHCDFNSDNNCFPFFHQNTEQYWEWILQILSYAENYNKVFINSPYLMLNDGRGFNRMLQRLKGMTSNGVGQVTLAENQTKLCAEFRNSQVIPESSSPLSSENKLIKAVEIISEFENNKIPDKSLSINRDRVIISPHEYAAAVQYINIHAKRNEIPQ
ncbi:MAG: aldolase/citrate lyase family protein [Ignavibacteriales bacterium]